MLRRLGLVFYFFGLLSIPFFFIEEKHDALVWFVILMILGFVFAGDPRPKS